MVSTDTGITGNTDPQLDLDHCVVAVGDQPPWLPSLLQLVPLLQLRPSELQQLLMPPLIKPTIACWQLRLNETVLEDKYPMLQPPHPALHPPSTPAALRQLEGELDPQLDQRLGPVRRRGRRLAPLAAPTTAAEAAAAGTVAAAEAAALDAFRAAAAADAAAIKPTEASWQLHRLPTGFCEENW